MTETSYIATSLTAGTTYEFKVESRNQYDYSEYSSTLTILSAYIAAVPDSVVTTIEGSSVKVAWSLSTDNGAPVTEYKVYIKEMDTDTTFIQENVDCVGTDSTVISNKYCHVTIATLIASPYLLDGGDSISAKVIAVNQYGESDYSIEGNGAYYTEIPNAPINLAEDISVRTTSTNGLTW